MAERFPQFNTIFPFRGLHEGVGYDIQPPATTPDAANVRAFDALKNRLRGGRRSGLSKYFASRINGDKVIQSISKTVEGVAYTSQDDDSAPRTSIDDDFSTYNLAVPSNTGNNYTLPCAAPAVAPGIHLRMRPCWGVDADGLILDNDNAEFSGNLDLMLYNLRFAGPNSVTATIKARPRATNVFTNTGAAEDCQCAGAYVRSSITRHQFVYACLIRDSSDASVTLQIRAWTQGTDAEIATSNSIALNDSATVIDGLEISLVDNLVTNELVARAYWPGGGAAGATIDATLTVTDTTHASHRCMGVGVFARESLVGDLPDGSKFRTFTRIQAQKYVPSLPNVRHTLSRTQAGANRYYIPDGYTGYGLDPSGGGSTAFQDGPYDSGSLPDGTNIPCIDTSQQAFLASLRIDQVELAGFLRTASDTEEFDVEYVLRPNMTEAPDGVSFFVVMDSSLQNGIYLKFSPSARFGSGDLYDTLDTATLGGSGFSVFKIVNGDAGDQITSFASNALPIHAESVIRLVRTAPNAFVLYVDNIATLITFSYDPAEFPGIRSGVGEIDPDTAGGATDPGIIDVIRWREQTNTDSEDDATGKTSSAKLILVSNGTVVGLKDDALVPIVNGDGALVSGRFHIQAQPAYNRTFFVDGTYSKVYNLSTNQLDTWIASTAGTLPVQTRLIALYRGRIVLAGTTSDPHNWFMSAVGDPFDWDYSPADTSPIQAVAGNNSDVGLVGDIITALIPFTDDIMLIGGDHTIWGMEGDPAAGGSITLVSDKTGIAWGKAWTKDPNGILYFWGQDGIYRFNPKAGEKPENMTRGLIDNRIASVDRDFNRIWMEWNFDRAELHILITPSDISKVCRWLVWESRSESWWEDEYPAAIGPNLLFAYDSALVNDRAFILGSRDGYLRKFDSSAETDDGTAISSNIRFAPFLAQMRDSEVKLRGVYPVLAADSGPVNLKVYTGQTAEGCVTSTTPKINRLIRLAGRNPSMTHKLRGYAIQLELTQTSGIAWALESISTSFDRSGTPRRQKVAKS